MMYAANASISAIYCVKRDWFIAIILAHIVQVHYKPIKKHEGNMHYLPPSPYWNMLLSITHSVIIIFCLWILGLAYTHNNTHTKTWEWCLNISHFLIVSLFFLFSFKKKLMIQFAFIGKKKKGRAHFALFALLYFSNDTLLSFKLGC